MPEAVTAVSYLRPVLHEARNSVCALGAHVALEVLGFLVVDQNLLVLKVPITVPRRSTTAEGGWACVDGWEGAQTSIPAPRLHLLFRLLLLAPHDCTWDAKQCECVPGGGWVVQRAAARPACRPNTCGDVSRIRK